MTTETITLGGGCFWCIDSAYRRVKGVTEVSSGYSGGETDNPNYEAICTGTTGHAEVVKVSYDTDVLSTDDVLMLFFGLHDPTTLNRQGADKGTQYRSIILYHNDEQKTVAEQMIAALNNSGSWPNPIVTQIAPMETFYPAETYHQDYFKKNPYQGYCQMVVKPKLDKFKERFADLLA